MDTIRIRDDHPTTKVLGLPSPSSLHTPKSMKISPCRSLCASVSLDETMSTCDSLKGPEFEYVENEEVSAVKSIERKATTNLYISEYTQKEGKISKRNIFLEMGLNDNTVAVGNTFIDPQFCAPIAHDIYKNARAFEAKKGLL